MKLVRLEEFRQVAYEPTIKPPLLAGDHTNWSRPPAVTFQERTFEHSGTYVAGNKPITIGQGYSTHNSLDTGNINKVCLSSVNKVTHPLDLIFGVRKIFT